MYNMLNLITPKTYTYKNILNEKKKIQKARSFLYFHKV